MRKLVAKLELIEVNPANYNKKSEFKTMFENQTFAMKRLITATVNNNELLISKRGMCARLGFD